VRPVFRILPVELMAARTDRLRGRNSSENTYGAGELGFLELMNTYASAAREQGGSLVLKFKTYEVYCSPRGRKEGTRTSYLRFAGLLRSRGGSWGLIRVRGSGFLGRDGRR